MEKQGQRVKSRESERDEVKEKVGGEKKDY